jgi:hypothetical protein
MSNVGLGERHKGCEMSGNSLLNGFFECVPFFPPLEQCPTQEAQQLNQRTRLVIKAAAR